MNRRFRKAMLTSAAITPAFAASTALADTTTTGGTNDPIAVVNNLAGFVFTLTRAVGIIMLVFGIVQFGISLKNHDPSSRANALLVVAGGLVVTMAKEILGLIGVTF